MPVLPAKGLTWPRECRLWRWQSDRIHTSTIEEQGKHPNQSVLERSSARTDTMLTYRDREIPETLTEIVAARHSALIVHELLNDWCAQGGALDRIGHRIDASGILPATVELIDAARRHAVPVIYVRYTMHADHSTFSDPAIRRYRRGGSFGQTDLPAMVVDGTWGWENLDEVAPLEGDMIVRKYRPDAFFATPLDALLRWNAISTAIFVGIGLEVGIVPSVMHAFNLGYFAVGVENCMQAVDPARQGDALNYIRDWGAVADHGAVIDVWQNTNGGGAG